MKVNLFATQEFEPELLKSTFTYLKKLSRLIEFNNYGINTNKFLNEDFNDVNAFKYCNNIRNDNRLSNPDDFVVCITSSKHRYNWFSHYDYNNNNIFVSTYGINTAIDEVKEELYIATEITGNIIQSLMKLRFPEDNQYIHQIPEGCVNDFCGDRKQIRLKMRAGFICRKCFNRAKENIKNEMILMELLSYTSSIRKDLIKYNQFDLRELPKLDIQYGKIRLGDLRGKELIKEERLIALYLFILKYPEGLTLEEMWNKRGVFKSIYRKVVHENRINEIPDDELDTTIDGFFKGGQNLSDDNAILKSFLSGTHGYLNEWKNKINKSISKSIQREISSLFSIQLLVDKSDKKIKRYKIEIDRGYAFGSY